MMVAGVAKRDATNVLPSPGRVRKSVKPGLVLAVAAAGGAVTWIDATIVNIAFPDIERSFHASSISTLSWVLNAYNILFAAFIVPAGRVADLVGRRRVFSFGLGLFTFASLLCALAPSVGTLIAFRCVQALGAACVAPSSLALVMHAFKPERRAHGAAMLSAVAAGAAGLGPSLGGLLIDAYDWRLVFLVNLPIGLSVGWLARRRLVESRAAGRRRIPDLVGALLLVVAMGALVLAVVQGQQWGWASPAILGSFAASLGFLAVFTWRCRTHRAPIIDMALIRIRSVGVANAMMVIGAGGFYAYTLTNVLFLTRVWDYSVLGAGLALTPGPLIAMGIARPSSRVAQRIGPALTMLVGCMIWSAGVFWLASRMQLHRELWSVWAPGIVLLGIGAGISFPTLSATAVSTAPGDRFATATGLNSVARQLGAAVGVAVVVAILSGAPGLQVLSAFHHSWYFGGACLLACGIGSLLLGRVRLDQPPITADDATALAPGRSEAIDDRPAAETARRALQPDASRGDGPQTTAEFLAAVPMFAGLDPTLLEQLADRCQERVLLPGEWLFHQGETADETFVLKSGRLQVIAEDSGVAIRELGRGDVIGELALLTGSTRSAGVRAVRTAELVAVDRESFNTLLDEAPRLALSVARTLAAQLRDTRAPVTPERPLPVTVALVGLGGELPLVALTYRLREACQRYGETSLIDPAQVPKLGADESATARYAPILDRAEASSRLVLLHAGSLDAPSPWLEFCLAQADRILVITGAEYPTGLKLDRDDLKGCDLVTYDVIPGAGSIDGIAAQLDPIESHALSTGTLEQDLARMARRLTGNSVGIVLSGGGARAFSHIGVLEELLAAGIQIDRVAGVSMGSLIGGMFAMGLDIPTIDAICFEEWVQRRPLGDYTLPRHSLIRGERILAMLARTFGETLVEELPKSFMCGFAELRSGRLVIARHGRLREQIAPSIRLPVIGPPQVSGRDIYIDGSFVDNLPIEPMAIMREGPIIAVDVKADLRSTQANGRRPEMAARAQTQARLPSLAETVARVMLLGSANTSEAARRHADLIIRPRAEGVGLLEFQQIDAAQEAGRVAARQALEQLQDGRLFQADSREHNEHGQAQERPLVESPD